MDPERKQFSELFSVPNYPIECLTKTLVPPTASFLNTRWAEMQPRAEDPVCLCDLGFMTQDFEHITDLQIILQATVLFNARVVSQISVQFEQKKPQLRI